MSRRTLLGTGMLIAAIAISLNCATTAEACNKCGRKSHYYGYGYGYGMQFGAPMGYGFGGPVAGPMMPPASMESPMSPLPPVSPPPGTLGRTYKVPTRPVPFDEHPRAGMLEIRLPEGYAADVLAQDSRYEIVITVNDVAGHFKPLEGFADDEGVWHFKSEPLFPGIPHIYEVRVRLIQVDTVMEQSYGRTFERKVEKPLQILDYRQVRLIRGRIVELEL